MNDILLLAQPLWQGRQEIAGFWWPRQRFDEHRRRTLLVQYWQPGALAYRFAEGDLLILLTPIVGVCETFAAWPLLRHQQRLYSAPVSASLQKEQMGDVNLVLGHQLKRLWLADAERLTVADWIDVTAYAWAPSHQQTATLAAQVMAEQVVKPVDATAPAEDLEAILGKVPERSARLKRFTQGIRQRQERVPAGGDGKGRPKRGKMGQGASGGDRSWTRPNWVWIMGFAILSSAISAFRGRQVEGLEQQRSTPAAPQIDPVSQGGTEVWPWLLLTVLCALLLLWLLWHRFKPSPNGRAVQYADAVQAQALQARRQPGVAKPRLWQRLLASMASMTQWSRFQQSRYVQDMMQKFEGDDLDTALKHAIPIDGQQEHELASHWGMPKPRAKLTLFEQSYGTGYGIDLNPQETAYLRQLYRRSFERLDQQGRVEEATFVLVELLSQLEEGLQYLEQHQRYEAAMKLALARDASPATTVRLCCQAGDWDMAVQVARRDHAFAAGVLALSGPQPLMAQKLRLEWAQALAEQGEWLAAVTVIWPLPEHRGQAQEWLRRCEQIGGALGAQALVKRALLLPDTLLLYQAQIRQLRQPEHYQNRLALATAVLQEPYTTALAPLVQALLPCFLRDHQQRLGFKKKALHQLLQYDPLIRTDLANKGIAPAPAKGLQQLATVPRWTPPDAGLQPITDAVVLQDGRYVIDLGEAGVLLINALGQHLQYDPTPCMHLVLAYNRQQVLLVAPQGQYWQVAKFDALTGDVTALGLLALERFSRHFDGLHWSVVQNNSVRLLAINEQFKIVWQVAHSPQQQVLRLYSTAQHEYWLIKNEDSTVECWTYELPARRLQSRGLLDEDAHRRRTILSPHGVLSFEYDKNFQEYMQVYEGHYHWHRCRIDLDECANEAFWQMSLCAGQGWLALAPAEGEGVMREIALYQYPAGDLRGVIEWPTDRPLQMRVEGADWLFFDAVGRLLHLNVDSTQVHKISVC